MGNRWVDYGVLETILLYRLGWDFCILAVIGRWLLCSGGCLLRFHCIRNWYKQQIKLLHHETQLCSILCMHVTMVFNCSKYVYVVKWYLHCMCMIFLS